MLFLVVVALALLVGCSKTNPFDVTQQIGYITVDPVNGGKLFYWMFEANLVAPSSAPLVLWLTGGPGCSSELALLFENGPISISDDLKMVPNKYSWNQYANLLYVDSPVGTGFSRLANPDGFETSSDAVAAELFIFLTQFFQTYPQYAKLDFYVFAESYGGHWGPAIASLLAQKIQAGETTIPFKGLGVGNGYVYPRTQSQSYPYLMQEYGLIKPATVKLALEQYQKCAADLDAGYLDDAFVDCSDVMEIAMQDSPKSNPYDVQIPCGASALCYNFTAIDTWLNLAATQTMLNVTKRWQACNNTVYTYFENRDFESSTLDDIQTVLDGGYKVLIYNGMLDLTCNWIGTSWYLRQALQWSQQPQWLAAPNVTLALGATTAVSKKYANLEFLAIQGAGHMVPHDQPAGALQMLTNFISS